MPRVLTFEGVQGSYDAPLFSAIIGTLTEPYLPYVQATPDGAKMIITLPDGVPVTVDAQIAQLAALHAYERTELRQRNEAETIRKNKRKAENLLALRAEIHRVGQLSVVQPDDINNVLMIVHDILKDMEV